jgi:transposase
MIATMATLAGFPALTMASYLALNSGFNRMALSFRITNNPEGHRALIKRLKGFDIARIVFEATGAYHRLFQQALVEAYLPWVKVNPCQARRFAQAIGKLAKTDRCDALMLARMGAALNLEVRAPASKTVEALRELVNARGAPIKDRVAALNRQAIAVSPLIKRQLAQRLRQIHGQIEAIDRRLKTLRNADPDLCTLRPPASSVWRLSQGTAARPMESDPSAAGAHEPDRLSTCPL